MDPYGSLDFDFLGKAIFLNLNELKNCISHIFDGTPGASCEYIAMWHVGSCVTCNIMQHPLSKKSPLSKWEDFHPTDTNHEDLWVKLLVRHAFVTLAWQISSDTNIHLPETEPHERCYISACQCRTIFETSWTTGHLFCAIFGLHSIIIWIRYATMWPRNILKIHYVAPS